MNKDLELKFKRDTGKHGVSKLIDVETSEYIPTYSLINEDELKEYIDKRGCINMVDPQYIEWLEEKVEELQNAQ